MSNRFYVIHYTAGRTIVELDHIPHYPGSIGWTGPYKTKAAALRAAGGNSDNRANNNARRGFAFPRRP